MNNFNIYKDIYELIARLVAISNLQKNVVMQGKFENNRYVVIDVKKIKLLQKTSFISFAEYSSIEKVFTKEYEFEIEISFKFKTAQVISFQEEDFNLLEIYFTDDKSKVSVNYKLKNELNQRLVDTLKDIAEKGLLIVDIKDKS